MAYNDEFLYEQDPNDSTIYRKIPNPNYVATGYIADTTSSGSPFGNVSPYSDPTVIGTDVETGAPVVDSSSSDPFAATVTPSGDVVALDPSNPLAPSLGTPVIVSPASYPLSTSTLAPVTIHPNPTGETTYVPQPTVLLTPLASDYDINATEIPDAESVPREVGLFKNILGRLIAHLRVTGAGHASTLAELEERLSGQNPPVDARRDDLGNIIQE